MTPFYYDLHIHSGLSPCGENDMTPNNILNMALLKELDLIALTDHNSCKNCPALFEVARDSGLTVLAGMELTTAEEIHVVCLFATLENAMRFDAYVAARLGAVENVPAIFGDQLVLDAADEIVGRERKLLVNATTIEISDAPALVREFGGFCYPAHIDRASYSVLANLGFIPPECGFRTVEVYKPDAFFADGAHADIKAAYTIVTSSDAHTLENIAERERCIHLETCDYSGLAARLADR